MKLSMNRTMFIKYVSFQLNNIFPDDRKISTDDLLRSFDVAIDRLDFCFKKASYCHYFDGKETFLNHLHADQYLMFIWFLSNEVYSQSCNKYLANKLYYLNKVLHGFDCSYSTQLPNVFLIFHGVGTVLGKASYSDYFVALQGCTVGSQKGLYPSFEAGVALAAGASVIGNCKIGKHSSISANSHVFNTDIPPGSVAYYDYKSSEFVIRSSTNSYAQDFFNIDLALI